MEIGQAFPINTASLLACIAQGSSEEFKSSALQEDEFRLEDM